jgi:hypothetical protein
MIPIQKGDLLRWIAARTRSDAGVDPARYSSCFIVLAASVTHVRHHVRARMLSSLRTASAASRAAFVSQPVLKRARMPTRA